MNVAEANRDRGAFLFNGSEDEGDRIHPIHRTKEEIPEVLVSRSKGFAEREVVKVEILCYQTDELKWQYAAVIVDNGWVRGAYTTFRVTDIYRNPLFSLKLMQRLELAFPSVEMAQKSIVQSKRFTCVTDGDLMARLKLDLER
ncbi:hypothetical protein LLE49_27215 [Alicyclobacillus tolerans]|uniref:hypothetical protein n=1 Tax=Alicyclobacillus tolerans TaxID=90970 RepID=UPI001F42494F|nr:hypothetical protein [Alicyclobacillus tolerans]MCF8568412.1 hypothetical protein [Alicyclobacillus tolerans]